MAAHTVSVVIPVYNGVEMLEDAVSSIYAQTVVPDEVIVVNDGSTDGTEALLRRLDGKLPATFRWVSQKNSREGIARNLGIEMATGDFVAFLDHDDLWHPDKTRQQLRHFASEPELSLSFTAFRLTTGARSELIETDGWDSDPEAVLARLTRECSIGTPSAVMVRREALARVPKFTAAVSNGADWLMWLHIAYAGMRVGYLSQPLVEYRRHGGNKSQAGQLYYEAACQVFEQFFATHRRGIAIDGRRRGSRWWRAHWHLLAAIDAIQNGDDNCARRHIVRAARLSPGSVRPGWVRMLGVGSPPR